MCSSGSTQITHPLLRQTQNQSPHPEHLHHLIAEVVDHLDGYPPGFGFVEGAGDVAVEGCPGLLVDFGLEGGFERLVGVAGTEEVGVADKK